MGRGLSPLQQAILLTVLDAERRHAPLVAKNVAGMTERGDPAAWVERWAAQGAPWKASLLPAPLGRGNSARAATSRALARLAVRGLLLRQGQGGKGWRTLLVRLTPAGRALAEQMESSLSDNKMMSLFCYPIERKAAGDGE